MKPPFAYYGGKTGMAALIVSLMPEHRVYIEPFFGSGAVFFAKPPAAHEILNDADRAVATFFRVLRDQLPELEAACSLTPHARAEFEQAADMDAPDTVEIARRFWARVNQSFGKTAGSATGWSVTTARSTSIPASIRSRIGRFAGCAERLAEASFESCDAAQLIERLATPDAVVYADPPYVATTRRGRTRGTAEDYRVDMGSDEEHERLAEVLHATAATVLLSGYHSPLYDALYGEWDRIEVSVNVHASNAVTAKRGTRTEVLWSNRALARGDEQLTFGGAA